MKKSLLCLTLALGSITTSTTFGVDPVQQTQSYEDQTVGKVDVKVENLPKGSSFDKQTVINNLRTRVGDPFSQYAFDQDLKQLAGEYDRVVPVISVKDGQVDVTLKVWLRPYIREIEWEGNKYLKTNALKKQLDIKPGILFNRAEFNSAFNKVKEYYLKKGYFESELTYKLVQIPDTREVDVVIQIEEGRSGKVDNIVFNGFTSKEESAILQKLYTKKYSNLTSWFTGMGKFNEEALEQDRLTIFNYLQNEGYADARVNIQILESPTKGKIIIDITADKGPLYRFGQVSFDGNILFTDEEVERIFTARPDGVYSPEKLHKTAEAIKDLYGRKGHIDTNVTYETQIVQDEPVYNVHFQVNEGREYRIGMVRIIGNVATESRVLLRESYLIPGETFDSLKLKVTQARLEGMGLFKSVNVYAVRTQDDLSLGDNYRDIYIEVEENQTGNISLFGGFSSADSIFGGLDVTEQNFNYRGLGRLFSDGVGAMRGGGEFFRMRAQVGAKDEVYMINWVNPYFNDTKWQLGFEFTANVNNRLTTNLVSTNSLKWGAFLNYPLTPYWTAGVNYRLDLAKSNFHESRTKSFTRDQLKNGQSIAQINSEINKGREQTGTSLLSGIGGHFTYNSLNHPMKPNRGLRTNIEGEFAGAGGTVYFFRTGFLNAYFTPLWQRGYMRYRADFRFLAPYGSTDKAKEIPITERFYLGGAASVRGYRDFSIGPELVEGDPKAPGGGISSAFLSIEYIQEIFPFLDAFLFMDGGTVSNKVFGLGTFRLSCGVGINVDLLGRMPITVGYGWPMNPENTEQKQNFFFTLGGQF